MAEPKRLSYHAEYVPQSGRTFNSALRPNACTKCTVKDVYFGIVILMLWNT